MNSDVSRLIKNIFYALFMISLFFISTTSQALPFIITPKTGTQLPVTVNQGQKVSAYYTVSNNTVAPRNNNYVKYLPLNTSQVVSGGTYGDTCGAVFNLAGKGQPGDSCTLQLTISGPVNSLDSDPHHHLFACFPGGVTCAGTLFPLNVSQGPARVSNAYISNFYNNTLSVCPIQNNAQFATCNTANGTFSAPVGVAINSQGSFIYVANAGNNSLSYCSINNTGDLENCSTAIPSFSNPSGIAINPLNTYIYVIENGSNQLVYCLLDSNGGISTCTTVNIGPDQPFGVAINRNGTYIYITYPSVPAVTSCTLHTDGSFDNCFTNALPTSGIAVSLTINPANTIAYVVNSTDISYCTILPNGTLSNCNTINDSSFLYSNAIALNAAGTYAYITNLLNDLVSLCQIKPDGSFDVCSTIGNGLMGPDGIAVS